MTLHQTDDNSRRGRGAVTGNRLSFAIAVLLLLATVFVVLPGLSKVPGVRQRIDFNDEYQIDGGATFYTDQPFMEEILARREASGGTAGE